MHRPKLFPTTGIAVTAIALTSVAHPNSPPQKNDPQINEHRIQGKTILEEGIRVLKITPAAIQSMKAEVRENGFLELEHFPLPDGSEIVLELREPRSSRQHSQLVIHNSDDPSTAEVRPLVLPDDVLILSGNVKGEEQSFAVLALTNDGSFGMIESSKGMSIISSGKLGAGFEPLIYNPKNALNGLLQGEEFFCEVRPGENHFKDRPVTRNSPATGGLAGDFPCKIVKVLLVYDYEFFSQSLGSDLDAAQTYTALMDAALDEIYRRDTNTGIDVIGVSLWNWDDPADPWDGADASEQLDELKEWFEDPDNAAYVNGLDHDVAMLFSPRFGGGLAFLEGLCNDNGYACCGNMSGMFDYPLEEFDTDNWDIMTAAHELGHVLGAIHTHDYCPTPLDECARSDLFGSCQTQQVCGQGTIMSYCHGCTGGMTNNQLGFHPQIAEDITNYVIASSCVFDGEPAVNLVDDFASMIMNSPPIVLDVLQGDTATCSDVQMLDFDETSAAGGSVSESVGTGPFGRDELIYEPPVGFVGVDTFAYMAISGWGPFGSATVTIDVQPQIQSQDLLVIDQFDNTVQRFDWENGDFFGTLVPGGHGGVDRAHAACEGPDGNLLVASLKNDYILRYDAENGVSYGVLYGGNAIDGPTDVVSDSDFVYVCAKNAQQIAVIDPNGNLLATYPIGATPNDILLEANRNRVLVAYGTEDFNGGVQIWSTSSHERLASFLTPEVDTTSSVARLADGDLLVGDLTYQRIARYDGQTFEFLGWFLTTVSSNNHNILGPIRIERGPDENIYVSSETGVHRLGTDGGFLGTLESTEGELLRSPYGLYFRVGERVVGDTNNDGLVDGTDLAVVLGDWGGSGAGDINRDGIVNGTDLAIVLGNWS